MKTTWTTPELNILRNMYTGSVRSIKEVAERLNKPQYAIRKKAEQLGLLQYFPTTKQAVKPKKSPAKAVVRIKKYAALVVKSEPIPDTLEKIEEEIISVEAKLVNCPDIQAWRENISYYNALCLKEEQIINRNKKAYGR